MLRSVYLGSFRCLIIFVFVSRTFLVLAFVVFVQLGTMCICSSTHSLIDPYDVVSFHFSYLCFYIVVTAMRKEAAVTIIR